MEDKMKKALELHKEFDLFKSKDIMTYVLVTNESITNIWRT